MSARFSECSVRAIECFGVGLWSQAGAWCGGQVTVLIRVWLMAASGCEQRTGMLGNGVWVGGVGVGMCRVSFRSQGVAAVCG